MKSELLILLLFILVSAVIGGPTAAGICYTGCNALWVTCCLAGGGIAGVTTGGAAVTPVILACNTGQSFCMSSCMVALFLPTP